MTDTDTAHKPPQQKVLTILKKNNVMLSDYKTYFDEPVEMFLDHQF